MSETGYAELKCPDCGRVLSEHTSASGGRLVCPKAKVLPLTPHSTKGPEE